MFFLLTLSLWSQTDLLCSLIVRSSQIENGTGLLVKVVLARLKIYLEHSHLEENVAIVVLCKTDKLAAFPFLEFVRIVQLQVSDNSQGCV